MGILPGVFLFIALVPARVAHHVHHEIVAHKGTVAKKKEPLRFQYFPQREATILPSNGNAVRVHLEPLTTRLSGTYPRENVVSPNGRFVYGCVGAHAYVDQLRIGPSGILRAIKPDRVDAHSHPASISFHPNGRFAYVSCSHGAICQYRITRSGQLVPLTPQEAYASWDVSPLRFDASGKYACVLSDLPGENTGNKLSIYRVGTDGQLTFMREIPFRDVAENNINGTIVVPWEKSKKVTVEK